MYFCEKCNALMPDARCAICGKKKLREVREDDFCLFVTLPTYAAHIFEETLKEEGIPVALLGYGLDFATRASSRFKIYVPYGYWEQARQIYATVKNTLDGQ